jgi:hypothetical protein
VTWCTSSDVHAFLSAAGDFLTANPIDHTVLLTEAAYLAARPSAATDQLYGWWQPSGGGIAGAFLQAPGHRPILSIIPDAGLESLVDLLPDLPPVGVDGRMVDSVVSAWRRRWGTELSERSRIRLYRLGRLHQSEPWAGRARVATLADRELLVTWYQQLMAAFPDDPSDLTYVVDDPISYAGMLLWEVDGTPKAMAGRSRLIAGMVRLGAVYAPQDDGLGEAALVAACEAARALARHVLIFASSTDTAADATYRALGFEPVLDRVMLALTDGHTHAGRGTDTSSGGD